VKTGERQVTVEPETAWQARAGDRQVRAGQADESYRSGSLRQEIGSWRGKSWRLAVAS
jgi:hypothetical protein